VVEPPRERRSLQIALAPPDALRRINNSSHLGNGARSLQPAPRSLVVVSLRSAPEWPLAATGPACEPGRSSRWDRRDEGHPARAGPDHAGGDGNASHCLFDVWGRPRAGQCPGSDPSRVFAEDDPKLAQWAGRPPAPDARAGEPVRLVQGAELEVAEGNRPCLQPSRSPPSDGLVAQRLKPLFPAAGARRSSWQCRRSHPAGRSQPTSRASLSMAASTCRSLGLPWLPRGPARRPQLLDPPSQAAAAGGKKKKFGGGARRRDPESSGGFQEGQEKSRGQQRGRLTRATEQELGCFSSSDRLQQRLQESNKMRRTGGRGRVQPCRAQS